jgi:hypothetical protein
MTAPRSRQEVTRVSQKLARASRTPEVVTCPCIMAVAVSAVSVCSALSAGRKMSDWNESAWMLGAAGHNPRGKGDDEECAPCRTTERFHLKRRT